MSTPEDAKVKVEGIVMSLLGQEQTWRAGRLLLRPLVERARVSSTLKKAALAGPEGLTAEEIVKRSKRSAAEIDEALTTLHRGGQVRAHTPTRTAAERTVHGRTLYTLATELPEVGLADAARMAETILTEARWPERAKYEVIEVFTSRMKATIKPGKDKP